MFEESMAHLEIILPSLLLVIGFFYKVLIDRRVTLVECIERLLEMPMEVLWLSAGFIIAYTLQEQGNHAFGLLSLTIGIILSLVIYATSKRSHEAFLDDKYGACFWLGSISFVPSLGIYIFSIRLLLQ